MVSLSVFISAVHAMTGHREIAYRHIRVPGAIYSLHRSYREARICYMRALVGREVCRVQDSGLFESDVSPVIPMDMTFEHWWRWCWNAWDEDDNLPVPTVSPR